MDGNTLFSDIYGMHKAVPSHGDQGERAQEIAEQTLKELESFRDSSRLFSAVWSNPNTTLFEEAEKLRRAKYGGYRKYMPHKKDLKHNEKVDELGRILPNVQHLRANGMMMLDNPITGAAYGLVAGPAIAVMAGIEDIWETADVMLRSFEALTALGFAGNLVSRNRNQVSNRQDFDSARMWDTAQYLDMVVDLARNNPEMLGSLRGHLYTGPRYASLNDKQRRLAYDNLFSNPFIQSVGASVAAPYRYTSIAHRI